MCVEGACKGVMVPNDLGRRYTSRTHTFRDSVTVITILAPQAVPCYGRILSASHGTARGGSNCDDSAVQKR